MDGASEATEALLDAKPEVEDGLRSVLMVDAERDSWGFEDVPLDSGAFGEIVSRGIVERAGDGYRVVDPVAVRAVLNDDQRPASDSLVHRLGDTLSNPSRIVSLLIPSMNARIVGLLALALVLVVAFRIVPIPDVFRGGDIVLSANDPYSYRWRLDQLLAETSGPFDLSVLSAFSWGTHNEPLLMTTLWFLTELLGGGDRTAGLVLAWFPVASAVVTGLFVYLLATRATNDWRVGIASVSFLAVMPLHAIRTGVGFADHHAFDYVWLALTAFALVALVDRDLRSLRTWAVVVTLGVAIAAQVLAWNNGPILLVPIGLYVALRAASDIRVGQSPLVSGAPVVIGVAISATIVLLVHLHLGWHTSATAYTPLALLAGIIGVLAAIEGYWRLGGSVTHLVAFATVSTPAIAGGIFWLFPELATELAIGVERLLTTEGVAEAQTLFGGHFLWIIGPLVFFGFALILSIVYMVWATWRTSQEHDPALLVVVVYGWYFFLLASLQIRFGAEYSLFAAVFAGLGFVHLAWWVDLARLPAPFERGEKRSLSRSSNDKLEWPERRSVVYLSGLWLGVGGFGAVMSTVKHSQLTTDADEHDVATWIATDAAKRELTYPENYVLSNWGKNRLYNYFVNGEAERYNFARDHYDTFLRSEDPDSWYEQLRERVGYVVLDPNRGGGLVVRESTESILSQQYGSRRGDIHGVAHYRVRYLSDRGRLVFELVPGATLSGQLTEETTVDVSTSVSFDGDEFTYDRRTKAEPDGQYTITVAHPGRYEIEGTTVEVTETAVRNGETVFVSE